MHNAMRLKVENIIGLGQDGDAVSVELDCADLIDESLEVAEMGVLSASLGWIVRS
jgi:hypothetical protein